MEPATPGPRIGFRPIEGRDLPALAGWLADPDVRRWWPEDNGLEQLEATYLREPAPGTDVLVIELDGVPSGLIQRYRLSEDPEWTATILAAAPGLAGRTMVGIDYLLGRPEVRNRGIGARMLALFAARTFDELPDVEMIVVDVQQDNRPSWRALERAGFRRIWGGLLDSSDPSDAGPAYLLTRSR